MSEIEIAFEGTNQGAERSCTKIYAIWGLVYGIRHTRVQHHRLLYFVSFTEQ